MTKTQRKTIPAGARSGYGALAHPRPWHQKAEKAAPAASALLAAPTHAEGQLMATLAIAFDAGGYRFDGVRYDSLADAVNQARFVTRRQEDAGGR